MPIPKLGPKEILVKVEVVGICAGDGKVHDGAERFWGKPGWWQKDSAFLLIKGTHIF